MKPTDKSGSKISTPQSNTHQKIRSHESKSIDSGIALLKKNEFALIIAGALVVTVIVFFVFFRSSEPKSQALPDVSVGTAGGSFVELEERIGEMASVLEMLQAKGAGGGGTATSSETAGLEQKVQRLETALSVKFDSLTERMGRLEKQIRALDQKFSVLPVKGQAADPVKSPQKAPAKTLVKKQAAKPDTKASIFHTVKKGETLWSIAQKYKTSVANLRKLNNMSSDVTLYPGTNILVR